MKTKYAPLGSISSGTMRTEDLIPEFLYVLGQLDKAKHDALVAEYKDVLDADEPDEEQADYCLEALFEALGERAAPYCRFGSHDGDGADFGFWVCWDSIEDDARCGTVLKVSAGDEWPAPLPEDVEYVLEVTDHGNGTLFDLEGNELWACV